ncbi:hypothetical protein [Nocardia australiensis]|uniref:hypothetical protein n=1 Tax=Nocardia australiensis TaxID=2887191 RepID=UPI001D137F32|nr:hypothetical protein [Nocardia australiensis]
MDLTKIALSVAAGVGGSVALAAGPGATRTVGSTDDHGASFADGSCSDAEHR